MFCLRQRQIPPATIQQFLRGKKGKAWIFWVKLRFFLQEQKQQQEEQEEQEEQEQQQNWCHVLVPGEVLVIARASKGTFIVMNVMLTLFILLPVYHAYPV